MPRYARSECYKCSGTGKTVNGKYCRCSKGDELKAQETTEEFGIKKPAPGYRAGAPTQEHATDKKKDKRQKPCPYSLGDWVKIYRVNDDINGVVCEIVEIDNEEGGVKILPYGTNEKGRTVIGKQWFPYENVQPAYVESGLEYENVMIQLEKAALERQIDKALENGDRKAFIRLTTELKTYG